MKNKKKGSEFRPSPGSFITTRLDVKSLVLES